MKTIYTRKGEPILVDDEDYERLNKWTWRLDKDGYAIRWGKHPDLSNKNGTAIRMHRDVMGLEFGDPREVDHIHHIKADNRKSELRICSGTQNKWNRRKSRSNTSGFKNVDWRPDQNKWRARISVGTKRLVLGYFETAEEAHEAYIEAAKLLHDEFAFG